MSTETKVPKNTAEIATTMKKAFIFKAATHSNFYSVQYSIPLMADGRGLRYSA